MGISAQSRHQCQLHPLNHRHKRMVEVYREERVSEVGAHLGSLLDNRAEITSMIGARIHLVIIGILPNVNSTKQNWDANSGKSTRLRTGRLKVNPAKIPNKDNDKSAVALLKDSRQLGCVFQDI